MSLCRTLVRRCHGQHEISKCYIRWRKPKWQSRMEGARSIEHNTPHEAKQYNREHLIEKQQDPNKNKNLG